MLEKFVQTLGSRRRDPMLNTTDIPFRLCRVKSEDVGEQSQNILVPMDNLYRHPVPRDRQCHPSP